MYFPFKTKEEQDTYIKEVYEGKQVVFGIRDVCFKSIMSKCESYRNSIISEILDMPLKEVCEKIEVKPTEYAVDKEKEKQRRSDFVVEVGKNYLILEANYGRYYSKIADKNAGYLLKLSSQVVPKRSDDFIPVYVINFDYLDRPVVKEDKIISKFILKEEDSCNNYPVSPVILHINLNKVKRKWYTKEKLTSLEQYLLMLVTTKKEELNEISEGNEILKEVEEHLNKLSSDAFILSDLSDEEEKEWIHEVQLDDAKKEGLEQGSQETKEEIVFKMHEDNLSNELIAKYTNLSLEQIEEIIANRG